MEHDFATTKRKIIQKRIKKKERYARMARIRYRKEKNVPLASVQCLSDLTDFSDLRPTYHFYMDLAVVEEHGRLSSDYSLLNRTKIYNTVSVFQEKNNLLSLKLQHSSNGPNIAHWDTVAREWEKRGGSYWTSWASRVRKFSLLYEDFIKEYRLMVEEGRLEKNTQKRQNEFQTKRNFLIDTQYCMEFRFRLEKGEIRASEMFITSKLVSALSYETNEFVDSILRGGFPRFHLSQNGGLIHTVEQIMDNFESIFSKDFEATNREGIIVSKGQNLNKALFNTLIGGYFCKGVPEISLIVSFDKIEPIRDVQFPSIYPEPYAERKAKSEKERKDFLERFYWDEQLEELEKVQDVCQIKQLDLENKENERVLLEKLNQDAYIKQKSQISLLGHSPAQLPFLYLVHPYVLQPMQIVPNVSLDHFEKGVENLRILKNKGLSFQN